MPAPARAKMSEIPGGQLLPRESTGLVVGQLRVRREHHAEARPVGAQAVVYIAARTLHLATLSASWRLAEGLDAAAELDVAAFWLTEQAPAALRTCHHLHGGMGMVRPNSAL